MEQKYKVFFNDTVVFFHQQPSDVYNSQNSAVLNSSDKNEIEQFINENALSHVVGKNSFFNFFADYLFIEAAGGLVLNEKNEILVILRLGKWDLPKGKIEQSEKIDEAAIREVEEECGIDGLKIIKELSPTYHTYELKGKSVLKKTHWFLMTTNFSGKLTPQTEENIEDVKWMPLEQVKTTVFANTYPAIVDVVSELDDLFKS
ncbi:MAG: NUDIX hydrolase [Bacteroidia bacterium]